MIDPGPVLVLVTRLQVQVLHLEAELAERDAMVAERDARIRMLLDERAETSSPEPSSPRAAGPDVPR